MEKRNIIVIGASAGGFEALKKLVARLPADLDAAIFIVWHMAPDIRGILPEILNRQGNIHAVNAVDGEAIVFNRIYVAPPDRHLIIEDGMLRITRGPKENRFRPAVDPLFRSAAFVYGPRVIGIILSGALDDGTAGLWTIKNRGGITIIQDPAEAEVPSMPENARRSVDIDYSLGIEEISKRLVSLIDQTVEDINHTDMNENNKTHKEVQITKMELSLKDSLQLGEFTPYACPECHGVLSAIRDGNIIRYRCHTGHAYSEDSLLASITENIEDTLWSAIRGVEEIIILLNNLGDHYAERNLPRQAASYFKKASEAEARAMIVRQAVAQHEQLTTESINEAAEPETVAAKPDKNQ